MKGIRIGRTRAVISIPALGMFLAMFRAGRMIEALVEMTEMGVMANDFGKPGAPGSETYFDADEATDLLRMLFLDDSMVDEAPQHAQAFKIDTRKQTLTVYFDQENDWGNAGTTEEATPIPPTPPPPCPPFPLRLLRGPNAGN